MKKELTITMDHQVREFCLKYLQTVGGKVAERLISAISTNDWSVVTDTKIDPRLYSSLDEFRRDYLSQELLRKYPGLPITVDRVQVAKDSFYASERECFITNRRLYPYVDNFGCLDEGVLDFINQVRKKVKLIIGEKPPEIADFCGFGPGATFDCRGKKTLLADKIEAKPTRTQSLFNDISHIWIYGQTAWGQRHALDTIVVRGNRFTTVPKDSLKDRGICVEPTLNLYLQKGYGHVLRACLKKAGIDLVRGQEQNGVLAQWASIRGDYATVDLSSASDSVSRSLVQLVLPEAWWKALDSCRSPFTQVDGKWLRLEKFSSMGNGFTFELETLIFAAICSCVIERHQGSWSLGNTCLVYGDDIIVPTKFARECVSALSFFGFTVNDRKTFLTGFFRESCGTDSFGGTVIKPLRIDSVPDGPEWWIAHANGVMRALRDLAGPYNPAWRYCVSQLPLDYRKLRGPERLGDAVLHDPNWVTVANTGEQLHQKKPRDKRFSPHTLWVKALLSLTRPVPWSHWSDAVQLEARILSPNDYSSGLTGRGCVVDRRIGWVSVS